MYTKQYSAKCFAWALIIAFLLQLAGCNTVSGQYSGRDGAPPGAFNANAVPDAVPKAEATSRYGNPASYKVGGKRYFVMKNSKGYDRTGYASWYGTKFHGQRTSSREPYDMFSMTAASTTLPIPTYVRVTNLQNGRSAIVKVNDRGPFHSNRIIDLSYAAASKLGYANRGTALVRVTAVTTNDMPKMYAANDNAKQSPAPNFYQPTNLKQSKTKSTPKLIVAENQPVYLQVGAYHDRSKALSVSKKIAALTQAEVSVKSGFRNHERIYRVHIGPLADGDQSSKVTHVLQKNGYEKPVHVDG